MRPGETISVEDAIKAVVTRSANDVAVAIAEAIGQTEDNFADMMTRKARELGMSSTLYRNASGLPNDEQVTTAHDLTILGRALEERFPRYFRYFSTAEFEYDGEVIGNHNHLLGRVDGVDGIKTGYTRASGFNLLTSVHRDGRSLIAVVMGGRSAGGRDRIMENLIADHLAEASTARTATMIAEAAPAERTDERAAPREEPPVRSRSGGRAACASPTGTPNPRPPKATTPTETTTPAAAGRRGAPWPMAYANRARGRADARRPRLGQRSRRRPLRRRRRGPPGRPRRAAPLLPPERPQGPEADRRRKHQRRPSKRRPSPALNPSPAHQADAAATVAPRAGAG